MVDSNQNPASDCEDNNDTSCPHEKSDGSSCLCRPCRLWKCLKFGMTTRKFQYGRDQLIPTSPPSYLGRPEFLMFCDPRPSNLITFIDVHKLISEASRLLNSGCESPLIAETQLEKLSLGFNFLKLDSENLKFFRKFGRVEFIDVVEYYFISVIKWIMRFDKFQLLERDVQMKLLNSIWHVFMKFHTCSSTATFRRVYKNSKPYQKFFRNVCMDKDRASFDTTWISDLPKEYVSMYIKSQRVLEDEQVLSEDLHFYYTEKMRNSRYAKRLAELLKVNNTMQKSIWKSRPLRDLNRVFNVVKVGFSHPQMFEDSAFCTGFEN
ncbi:hypothetical protein L3Y34_006931 [Caenorhabditis briggsae]|uniref:NR LBD domain-containing protein n=1 Tax=Caenorhabditis briggsae TaxID=6238 RepID=A0AAE9A5G8_CAEBR|nr:hypothetical protein L3Y34_006931 [Caenorhabditis briggsae]